MNRRDFLNRLLQAGALVAAGPGVLEAVERWVEAAPTEIITGIDAEARVISIADLDAMLKQIFRTSLTDSVMQPSQLLSLFEGQAVDGIGGRYIETAHFFEIPPSAGGEVNP